MSYIKTIWEGREGTNLNRFDKAQETSSSVILHNRPTHVTHPGTKFSTQNMNKIENGIYDAHELIAEEESARLAEMQNHKADANAHAEIIQTHNTSANAHADIRNIINSLIGLPEWDSFNHIITFTAKDGSTLEVNIPLEELTKDIDFDTSTKEIILFKHDGTEIRIDVSDLVDIYTGSIGTHIQITVGEDNRIKAVLLAGSITETELSAALLAKIDEKANKSEVISLSEKGSPGGVATLDENGKLHPDQLPEAASPDAAQFLAAHPVLSIYMTVAPDESTPAQMAAKHGGTWTVWGAGRVPVGVGTSDRAFAIGEKGGASTHTLTEEQLAAHHHMQNVNFNPGAGSVVGYTWLTPYQYDNLFGYYNGYTLSAGKNKAHNNLQPYETCYIYQRSA